MIKYKHHLKYYVVTHQIIGKTTDLQKKLTKLLLPTIMQIINELDVLLTKGMIKAERMIKKYGLQFLLSSILAISIIELAIWKLINSELKGNTSRDTKIHQLTTRLHNLDNSYTTKKIKYERTHMKIINKHIKKASKNLKKIQKKSYNIREDYLKEKLQETKIDGNKKNVTYLSNLILTEYQQRIHRRIKHHTNQSNSSGIK